MPFDFGVEFKFHKEIDAPLNFRPSIIVNFSLNSNSGYESMKTCNGYVCNRNVV